MQEVDVASLFSILVILKFFSQTLFNRQIGRLLKSQFHNTALVFVFIEEERVEHIMSKADGIF